MHIALWSPAWPLEKFQNGIVTYVHWLKRGLEERGHRVSVFTGELAGSDEARDIHLATVGIRARLERALLRRHADPAFGIFDYSRSIADAILRVHRRDPIDLIEMEESFGWFADVASRTRIPLVVKLHGPAFLSLVEDELRTPFAAVKIAREGDALRRADAIASPCASTLADTIARYELSPRLTRHIVNPLTMAAETPVWRVEHSEPETLLFVGRFDLRKGADIVLQAFLSCLRERPQLKLIFVGPDRGIPDADGKTVHFAEYSARLFPEALRDRVEFRGPQRNTDIAKLRVRAAATIVASRWENPGYTLLEAMYQGCPVVTTDAAGCRESVVENVSALLARSGDAASFARQLLVLLEDPARAQALGTAARQQILARYSGDAVAGASLDFYETVLRKS